MDLMEFLGGTPPDRIIAAMAERTLLHLPQVHASPTSPDRPRLPFGWPEFVEALNLYRPDSTDIRITKAGSPVNTSFLHPATGANRIDGAAFEALARQGISIILNRMECRLPVLDALRRSAERMFGMAVTIGCIATFGKGGALKAHYDPEDILLFQVEGAKHWDIIGAPTTPPPGDRVVERLPDKRVVSSFTVRAGDAMLLPWGLGHRCDCLEPSLHLGIVFRPPMASAYLSWLLTKAEADPRFRPGPPIGSPAEDQARFDAGLETLVKDLMAAHPPAAWRSHLARRIDGTPVTVDRLPLGLPLGIPVRREEG